MKKITLLIILSSIAGGNISKGQTFDLIKKHQIGIGPILGYDYKLEGTSYGVGLMYEFRPFNKLGFTAALNYEQSRKNLSAVDFSNTGAGVLKHHVYSLSLGTRYHFSSFYLGGSLGLAYENGETTMNDGSNFKGGNTYSLYKTLGFGYQLPLKNGDLLEMEIGTFGTKNSMKIGGTLKYKFLK